MIIELRDFIEINKVLCSFESDVPPKRNETIKVKDYKEDQYFVVMNVLNSYEFAKYRSVISKKIVYVRKKHEKEK